jgi:hypothetical protein
MTELGFSSISPVTRDDIENTLYFHRQKLLYTPEIGLNQLADELFSMLNIDIVDVTPVHTKMDGISSQLLSLQVLSGF